MEQLFFTQKDQIGKQKDPIEKMASGGLITPKKPIEKMTLLELQEFVREFDPIKFETMNWFKGQTRKGLRVQVQTIYDKYVARSKADEASRLKIDDFNEMDDLEFYAGGGTAGQRKAPNESATSVQEGTLAIGNDGTFYTTVKNKNGVASWRQVSNLINVEDLNVMSWTQGINGTDKAYNGFTSIVFYWGVGGTDFSLTIRQITPNTFEIEQSWLGNNYLIKQSDLLNISNFFVDNNFIDVLTATLKQDPNFSYMTSESFEPTSKLAGTNLQKDVRLIDIFLGNLESELTKIFANNSAVLNKPFVRTDLRSSLSASSPQAQKTVEEKPVETATQAPESIETVLPLSEKSAKEVSKEVKVIVDNVEAPKKTRKELKQDYADLSFLISITPPTDVISMSALKQQARMLKDDIDRLGLIEKDVMLAENHIFDELFQASSVQPKHRYNLTPSLDGFAPDGTPTKLPRKIYEMVHTDAFEDWFGNFQLAYQFQNSPYQDVPCSIVKNEHFEPQIVYHGTGSEFSFFDFNKFPAMYFAENIHYAEWFANQKGGMEGHDGYVYPFMLNIKNPLDLTHFGIKEITVKEFTDWLYLQCGLTPEELKMNTALLNPNQKFWAWVFLRNGSEMLKVLRDTKLFDGIVYYEQNPPIDPSANNYMTKGFIIFEANNAKIVDPERHNVLLASMRSFYLKKGGKL